MLPTGRFAFNRHTPYLGDLAFDPPFFSLESCYRLLRRLYLRFRNGKNGAGEPLEAVAFGCAQHIGQGWNHRSSWHDNLHLAWIGAGVLSTSKYQRDREKSSPNFLHIPLFLLWLLTGHNQEK